MAILEPYIKQQIIDETSIPSISDDSIVVGCLVDSDTGPSTITPMAGSSEFIKNYLESTTVNAEDNTTIKHVSKLLQFTPVYVNRVQGGDVLVGKTDRKEDLFFSSDFTPYTQATTFQFVKPTNRYQYAYVVVDVDPTASFTMGDGASTGYIAENTLARTEGAPQSEYKAIVVYINNGTEGVDGVVSDNALRCYEELWIGIQGNNSTLKFADAPANGFVMELTAEQAEKIVTLLDFGEVAFNIEEDDIVKLFVKPTGVKRNVAMPTETDVPLEDVFLNYNEIASSLVAEDGTMLPNLDRVTFTSGYVNVSSGLKTTIPSFELGGVCPAPVDVKTNVMTSDYYLLGLARSNGDVGDTQLTDETEVGYRSYITINGASYHIQQPDGVVASYPTTDVSIRFFGDYNSSTGKPSFYSSGAVSPERFFIYFVDKQLERYFSNPGVTAPSISTATLEMDTKYMLPSNQIAGTNDLYISTSTTRLRVVPHFWKTNVGRTLVDTYTYLIDNGAKAVLLSDDATVRYITQKELVSNNGNVEVESTHIIDSNKDKQAFEKITRVATFNGTTKFELTNAQVEEWGITIAMGSVYEFAVHYDTGVEVVIHVFKAGDAEAASIHTRAVANCGTFLESNLSTHEVKEADGTKTANFVYIPEVTLDYTEGSNVDYTKNYVSISTGDKDAGRPFQLTSSKMRVAPTDVTTGIEENVSIDVNIVQHKFRVFEVTNLPIKDGELEGLSNVYQFDVNMKETESTTVSVCNGGSYASKYKFVSSDVFSITKFAYRVKELLCSDMYKTSGNFGFIKKQGISGKNMLLVPVLDNPNALYSRSDIETYDTNMPSNVVDEAEWGWSTFMYELSGSDSNMYEYNISGQMINDNETLYKNQWVVYREKERGYQEAALEYVFYNGEYPLDQEPTTTYVQLSSAPLTWEKFVSLLRSEMGDYFTVTNIVNGIAIWSTDNTRESFIYPMDKNYVEGKAVIPDELYITRREIDYRPVVERSAFAMVSRYLSKTNKLGFSCVKNESDPELYTLTLSSIADGESTDYTISFVDDKVDGYGMNVYYNRVNNMSTRMYMWRNEDTENLPADVVDVPSFGSSAMARVVRAEAEDYVKAIEKFKLFQGWYYTFIFDGGFVNATVAKALAEMGDSIFAKALVTLPDVFDYKQLIEYRQATGIDTYEAKFIEPHFNDTTVGDFVSILSPHCYHIEKVIANKSGGKEFAPVFGITNGSIVNIPKYRRLKAEQREALINQQINTVIYDQVRGLSYFNLDLSAQLRDSDLSDDNNVRLVNEITHVCDRELIYFIGKFNTTSTRDEVVSTLTRAINERVVVNQSYTAKDIKVICDTSNNTQDIIRARKLVVDVEIWTQRGIRYIHVYHRVKNLEE